MSEIVLYEKKDKIAFITLNRPKFLNAINDELPSALENAVERANEDQDVHVIILKGNGKGFCSGYDLKLYAETPGENAGYQLSESKPWDSLKDYAMMRRNTNQFMSLFRSPKPTICIVHGVGAVAGGSDIALCCDFILMQKGARFGYPPARIWGCPTTAMWVFKCGIAHAKRYLMTGDLMSAEEAFRVGVACEIAEDFDSLNQAALKLAHRMTTMPLNQLAMQKLVLNQALHNQGLESQQILATVMDGVARHTPEGVYFKKRCEKVGFKQAVKERDNPKAKL